LFQKRIYSIFRGTLVGKRKQTIFKKRWFDITSKQHTINRGRRMKLAKPKKLSE
jgi:hypothetical protein